MSAMTPAWESNTTPAEVASVLRRCGRVICVTHARPDGDAAGSSLAICRALRHVGVDAQPRYIGPEARWLAQLAGDMKFRVDAPGVQVPLTRPDELPDMVVVTDTGSWTQLAEVTDWLKPLGDRTVVIDHHLHGNSEVAKWRLIDTSAAATTQVLAPVCAALLSCEVRSLPRDVAEALYLGLATDTQWFRLSNVTPATLRLAADLLDAGVNHTSLYEMIEQRDSPSRWRLAGRALSSLELHVDGQVAVMQLSLRDFAEAGADRNDTGGFADMVQHIETVRISVILTESETRPGEPPMVKVSMRSKPGPDAVDVNALTRSIGGGGHARAAGAKMVGCNLVEARRRLLELLVNLPAKNHT